MNYAIGRVGDGGDRNVEEVAFVEPEGTEARIEVNRSAQALKTAEFLDQVPTKQVEVTANDGIRLSGVAYEQQPTDNRWAIVVHGYHDSHEASYVLDMAQHYYDAGFNVFSSELYLRFGLPEFPLLYSASAPLSAMAGYSFEEASALEAVARSEKPMLFIHGTADDFIPFDMMG